MNAGDDMAYKFHDVGVEIQYHVASILSGIKFKALVAGIPAMFATYFGGDWRFFEVWFALSVLDLVLGVALALKTSSFSRAKLYGWVVKALTHTGTILIFGVITVMLIGLTGHALPLIDWFIFVLAVTESASILSSAEKLGLPVHPLARALVEKCRRRAEAKLDALTSGKENEANKERETDLL